MINQSKEKQLQDDEKHKNVNNISQPKNEPKSLYPAILEDDNTNESSSFVEVCDESVDFNVTEDTDGSLLYDSSRIQDNNDNSVLDNNSSPSPGHVQNVNSQTQDNQPSKLQESTSSISETKTSQEINILVNSIFDEVVQDDVTISSKDLSSET